MKISDRNPVNSLSARLLILTMLFVMLVEVLVFVPSVARFRVDYLEDKLSAAHLAILALDATPDGMVSETLKDELLGLVGAHGISAHRDGARIFLRDDMPATISGTVDLREGMPRMSPMAALDALKSLVVASDRTIRVIGPSPKDPSVEIEVIIDEGPLCQAIVAYAERIFWLSLLISMVTGLLVFFVLRWQFVRPMRRLIKNMLWFRENPEDARRVVQDSGRSDELGIAQRQLADMQMAVRAALNQSRRLAALGTAVAKINHDLRGILSSALLMSDRLESSEDPEVRRVTPVLISSIERAVSMCSQTLGFAGQDQPPPDISRFSVDDLVQEVAAAQINGAEVMVRIGGEIAVDADRDQLFRAVSNLTRNAAEAGADQIDIMVMLEGGFVSIDIMDNGPGLPPRAVEKLFRPFEGSARAGGTGLGLAIARELSRNHGGDLVLVKTSGSGTCFRMTLPLTQAEDGGV